MNWLARFDITAALWLVIPFTGVSGAEREYRSDWQSNGSIDRKVAAANVIPPSCICLGMGTRPGMPACKSGSSDSPNRDMSQ